MIFTANYIEARTIEDAWRDAIWCCVRNGYDYRVGIGSYAGQIRRQLDYVVLRILEPWTRPLAVRMPEGTGFPPPTSEEKIDFYFARYIMGEEKSENEDIHGQYIAPTIHRVIELLINLKGVQIRPPSTLAALIQFISMTRHV